MDQTNLNFLTDSSSLGTAHGTIPGRPGVAGPRGDRGYPGPKGDKGIVQMKYFSLQRFGRRVYYE